MKHLQKLLGRGPSSECMPGSDSGSSVLEQEEPIAPLYVDNDAEQDQSSDDDLVEQIMSLPDEYANLPPFNVLDPLAVQRPNLLPAQSDKSAQEQEESIELAESADDIDIEAIEEKVLKKNKKD